MYAEIVGPRVPSPELPLRHRVAVKTQDFWHGWQHERWPGEGSRGRRERWPVQLMDQAVVGDKLWWCCSDGLTFQHLCGSAGRALLRAGRVLDHESTIID